MEGYFEGSLESQLVPEVVVSKTGRSTEGAVEAIDGLVQLDLVVEERPLVVGVKVIVVLLVGGDLGGGS